MNRYANPDPQNLAAVGSTLYFAATDASGSGELWKYDGTTLTEITVGTFGSDPYELTAVGSTLYFADDVATNDSPLWKYDGTTLTDITPGAGVNFDPGFLTAVGSTLYFVAFDGTTDQLWGYDSDMTAATIVTTNTGGDLSSPGTLSDVGSALYLAADDGSSQNLEPWVVRPTPAIVASDSGGAYTGKPFPATATVNGAASLEGISPTLAYYAGSTAMGKPLRGAPSAAGAYTVVASFPGTLDYASTSAQTPFTIRPTVVESSANVAANATTFVIHGAGFNRNAADDSVLLSSGSGRVIHASATALTISVSGLTVGSLFATVIADGASCNNTQVANVIAAATNSAVSPGEYATSLIINGLGFDPTTGGLVLVPACGRGSSCSEWTWPCSGGRII